MSEFGELVLGLGGLGLLILGLVLVAKGLSWVLGPLDRAARDRSCPAQFTLADFLCLFVLIQLPLAALHWAAQGPNIWALDVLVCLAFGAVWWTAVRTLSRAGVHRAWHRSLCLAVVVPAAFSGAIMAPGAVAMALVELCESGRVGASLLWLAADVVIVALMYGMGRFTRAVVAAGEDRDVKNGGTW
jgi:hypothetical protein